MLRDVTFPSQYDCRDGCLKKLFPLGTACGETGTLSVTVPGNVVSVKVGGEEVTLFTLNEDGTRTFTWTATPETAGQYRYTVILEEGHGYRFDAGVTPLLTVNEPAAEPADSNESESSDDGQNGGSHTTRRLCSLLQAILNFFRKIVAFFKSGIA